VWGVASMEKGCELVYTRRDGGRVEPLEPFCKIGPACIKIIPMPKLEVFIHKCDPLRLWANI
jgi:hypothetical protein